MNKGWVIYFIILFAGFIWSIFSQTVATTAFFIRYILIFILVIILYKTFKTPFTTDIRDNFKRWPEYLSFGQLKFIFTLIIVLGLSVIIFFIGIFTKNIQIIIAGTLGFYASAIIMTSFHMSFVKYKRKNLYYTLILTTPLLFIIGLTLRESIGPWFSIPSIFLFGIILLTCVIYVYSQILIFSYQIGLRMREERIKNKK